MSTPRPEHREVNRAAWEAASTKHVREHDEMVEQLRAGGSLLPLERALLADVLATAPRVVHLQSGHGIDDAGLLAAGAGSVLGIDFSTVAVGAARRRAREVGLAADYVVAALPDVPLADGCAGLVYTGKGALIWLADLDAWAAAVARVLEPGGVLFVHEEHPMAPLWSWDPDVPRVRDDRSYFGTEFVVDAFPDGGAVVSQHTLGEVVTAVAGAGLRVRHLAEHPDPFWWPGGVDAAAWRGRLPNAYSLLAERPRD
ncbi:SAM-dependent methyltransferase [Friedmanniella endophytica]|uniref:SAM-dependent methyltransferase n=1 Tax=Microlunatus kandeliicorticis TaxID=1759536 RepID=A0A7W3P5P4_9ACTN|nr:methyltransferase domain-containing protein [Microlunatus kandeliicorticis]MBA8794189.1 SAM-dependent methyltransferase [Microlunatus kandeliicorticis]